jgi:hypothetical protein
LWKYIYFNSADVTTDGDCAGSYSVTRTWTATDSCGNSSTASQTINVQDKTAPVIAAYRRIQLSIVLLLSICCSDGDRCLWFCFHVNFCRCNH